MRNANLRNFTLVKKNNRFARLKINPMVFLFYKRLSEYFKIYLLFLGVFFIFRVIFLCSYCNFSEIFLHYKYDLLKTFWHGFRCDTVVLSFALTPLLILNLLGFLFYFKQNFVEKYHYFLILFAKIYYYILFILFFVINMVDYFYYRNFQTHFDNRVFGFIEDGTKEVMGSVWSDYPVIIIVLIFIVLLFGWIKIVNRLQRKKKPLFLFHKWYAHIATVILSFGVWFLGARSSLSVFPFQKNDLTFSANVRLNDAAANGVFTLKETISDRLKFSLHLNEKNLLSAHKFSTLEEAKRAWNYGIMKDDEDFFERKTTPYNSKLENSPPNIVLIIMEGWSSDFFNFHSSRFNLMGALQEEMPHLIFYPFCFPVNYGTISAMETFITNNVGFSLSLSEYSNIPLKSSTAVNFQKVGYETSYYTSGYTGWRNVGKYFRTQQFDNVRGAEYLKSLYPQAEESDWGVYDQYLFDAITQKLQEKNSQPQFFICMTITNHSPHKIPKKYQLYPLEPDELQNARTTGNLQQTQSIMQTFQYANDCLGKFIHNLRHSSLAENTIVVVTGDHSMTGGFQYQNHEWLYQWAVPLMFYIPEQYAQQLQIDTTRLVSHKDILPTIYHLAFSNYEYDFTGDNIFETATAENSFVITQSSWVIGKSGCIHLNTHQSFSWKDNTYFLQPQETTEELEDMRKRANAWLFGMKWQIYSDLKKYNFAPEKSN